MFLLAAHVSGQTAPPLDLLAEIADSAERKALRRAYDASKLEDRLFFSRQFVALYPRSAFLAHAYEIAAQAAYGLQRFPEAEQDARKALRLLPENPALLTTLAGVLAYRGDHEAARIAAVESLDYLERFEWRKFDAGLRASLYKAAARTAIALSLQSAEPRPKLLRQALRELGRALTLMADDEAWYMLGLCHAALGDAHNAARSFRRARGSFEKRSLARLRTLHPLLQPGEPWEVFLSSVVPADLPAASPKSETSAHMAYAGSGTCRPCHAKEFRSWQESGMGKMLRTWQPAILTGDFAGRELKDGSGRGVARATTKDRRPFLEIGGVAYRVDYVIGSKWQQAYATELPSGRLHVFPFQFSLLRNEWLNYWKLIDPPGSPRADPASFSRLDHATDYRGNCAPCHTSGFESSTGAFREAGVNCEMCHGPAGDHVTAMQTGDQKAKRTEWPVRFRQIDARTYVGICGQCHRQSAVRQPHSKPAFPPRIRSRPYGEFSRKAFYRDGRFRETTFIVESFERSQCFRKGNAHCGHCHDPHPPDASANPVSLKFRADEDEMCLQCHAAFRTNPQLHTRHAPNSEGARCVTCHMPRIMNALLFQARTHRIDDIPDPDMTERFGREESPLACLACHDAQGTGWVRERLAQW